MQDQGPTVFMVRVACLCASAPQLAQWGADPVRRALGVWSLTRGAVGRRCLLARTTPAVCEGSRAALPPCALNVRSVACLHKLRGHTCHDQ